MILGSPTDEPEPVFRPLHPLYSNEEVEELLKKQLEIEQEVKTITVKIFLKL